MQLDSLVFFLLQIFNHSEHDTKAHSVKLRNEYSGHFLTTVPVKHRVALCSAHIDFSVKQSVFYRQGRLVPDFRFTRHQFLR